MTEHRSIPQKSQSMKNRQIQNRQACIDDKTPSATGGYSIISYLFKQTSLIHDCKHCNLFSALFVGNKYQFTHYKFDLQEWNITGSFFLDRRK